MCVDGLKRKTTGRGRSISSSTRTITPITPAATPSSAPKRRSSSRRRACPNCSAQVAPTTPNAPRAGRRRRDVRQDVVGEVRRRDGHRAVQRPGPHRRRRDRPFRARARRPHGRPAVPRAPSARRSPRRRVDSELDEDPGEGRQGHAGATRSSSPATRKDGLPLTVDRKARAALPRLLRRGADADAQGDCRGTDERRASSATAALPGFESYQGARRV